MEINLRTLYVENFPLETSKTTLNKLFTNFGKVTRVELPTFSSEHPLCKGLPRPKSKGYAFVEFLKQVEADQAREFFNNLDTILLEDNANNNSGMNEDISNKIVRNLEYRKFRCLRVMTKENFTNLTELYIEQRLSSLVGAAKLLAI